MPGMKNKSKEIIVIGSGFGGLSAAIRLASAGHKVTIYEKRDKIGGRAYQYEVNGFKFDGGPTVITAPYMFDELFALGGRDREDYFKLLPVDPFYRIFDENGRSYTYHRDLEKAKQEVARISPDDVDGFERFVQSSVEILKNITPSPKSHF
jgi:phytoene desaturase